MQHKIILKIGNNARIRELMDGSYVAEIKVGLIFKDWKGINNKKPSFPLCKRHKYEYCRVSSIDEAKTLLADRGF